MIRTKPKVHIKDLLKTAFEEGINRGLQAATMHARLQIVGLQLHLPNFLVPGDVTQVALNLQHLMQALKQFERDHSV